ncbi:MAG: Gfo/Idh/MocA family oxidoreductase [Candidatus Hydrogenedentes bacterium]|nr:Gfo/Idh/MocA family oxidoreductase [Candidatus Hydrogenedentota bacterium]
MEQVGFGIIGCGAIAPIHAQSIAEIAQTRLVAVADVVEASARKLGAAHGAEIYTDYRRMLERKDVHAVCLCVPSGMRVEIAETCAQAGKHILAEKPLEVTSERIDRLIRAADRNRIKLGCIFQYRFAEDPRLIRQAIDAKRFGRLVLGDAYIKWYRSQEYYASGAWRGTRRLDGGGVLMNQGVHQIDLLIWFMGPVKRVTARTSLIGHKGLEVEDLACALLEFENGAMGSIEGSTAIWPGHPARVEVHGSDGSAILEDGKLRFWRFKNEAEEDAVLQARLKEDSMIGSGASDPVGGLKHEGHRRQIEDFAQAILERRAPAVDGREARHAVALIEAIYKSAETGEPVDF